MNNPEKFQTLINHILKSRDGYFKIVSNQSLEQNEMLIQKAEYFEHLWIEAIQICIDNGWRYEDQTNQETDTQGSQEPETAKFLLSD